jgi:hypothetical protein
MDNESAGLTVMGFSYAAIGIKKKKNALYLVYNVCKNAEGGNAEEEKFSQKLDSGTIWLRVKVGQNGLCHFSYSMNGQMFIDMKDDFQAEKGRWIGARVGLYCVRNTDSNDAGFADFDWFRVGK